MPSHPWLFVRRRCVVFLAVLALALASGVPLWSQIEEEDLPELERPGVDTAVLDLFARARELMQGGDALRARQYLSQVISVIETTLNDQSAKAALDVLVESLGLRARASFDLGDVAQTQADLARLLELHPDFALPPESPADLAQALDARRRSLLGRLRIDAEPADALIYLTRGSEATPSAMLPGSFVPARRLRGGVETPVLAGRFYLVAERPGYAAMRFDIEIATGESKNLPLQLQRESATIQIRTQPIGAVVLVDGIERGRTGAAENTTLSDADPTDTLWVDDLGPGSHDIEIRKDGFRTHRARITVDSLRDMRFQPVVLEAQSATVVFRSLPADAKVTINSRAVRPARGSDGQVSLTVVPGDYRLSIIDDQAGVFESNLVLVDRDRVELNVALRPALVFLGVLGNDQVAASKLRSQLAEALARGGRYTLLDRSSEGAKVLPAAGIEVGALRDLATPGKDRAVVDWARLQQAADRAVPAGAIYALAALDDDLMANDGLLWFWPPAPGPSRPDLRRVAIEDSASYDATCGNLLASLFVKRISLGALLTDSSAAAAPVVMTVDPGGPAARAAIRPGDQVTQLAGTPTFTASDFEALLQKLGSQPVEVEVVAAVGSGARTIQVTPRETLAMIDPSGRDLVYAGAASQILRALEREGGVTPRWQLQLGLALLLMRGEHWQQAVDTLRRIEAPNQSGIGQATVDYYLGMALLRAGPRYFDRAREAFAKAAQNAGGRLLSDDGPLVAPRARARMASLGTD